MMKYNVHQRLEQGGCSRMQEYSTTEEENTA